MQDKNLSHIHCDIHYDAPMKMLLINVDMCCKCTDHSFKGEHKAQHTCLAHKHATTCLKWTHDGQPMPYLLQAQKDEPCTWFFKTGLTKVLLPKLVMFVYMQSQTPRCLSKKASLMKVQLTHQNTQAPHQLQTWKMKRSDTDIINDTCFSVTCL